MLTNVSGVLEKHVTDVYSVSTFVSSIFCRFFCFSSSRWKHSPTIRFMTFVINWFRLVEIVKWKNYLSSGSLKWKDSLSPNSKLYSPNSDNPVPSHQEELHRNTRHYRTDLDRSRDSRHYTQSLEIYSSHGGKGPCI